VALKRYSSVDDCGQPINPLILHGQVHGGIARAPGRRCRNASPTSGRPHRLLTGSFMDYAMPRADMMPSLSVELAEDPTKGNPLRVKGGGEAGITPALAAIMNASSMVVVHGIAAYGHAGLSGASLGRDRGGDAPGRGRR